MSLEKEFPLGCRVTSAIKTVPPTVGTVNQHLAGIFAHSVLVDWDGGAQSLERPCDLIKIPPQTVVLGKLAS